MSKRDEKRETRTADAVSAGSGERKPSAIHRIFTGLFRLVLVLLETVLLVAMLLYGVMIAACAAMYACAAWFGGGEKRKEA